jgi:hypothetical protein
MQSRYDEKGDCSVSRSAPTGDAHRPGRRHLIGVWLAIGVTLVCLLTADGTMTTTDAVIAYELTRSLVERGSIALPDDARGYEAYRGVDGRSYSPFGVAQSIFNIPFYAAGRRAAQWIGGAAASRQTIPKAAVALATVPTVALLAWVCFEILLRLGAAPAKSLKVVLLLIFATPLWPYSTFGFNQPLAAVCIWSAVLGAVGPRQRPAQLVASGAASGLAILTRHEMLLAAMIVAVYVVVRARDRRLRALAWHGVGLMPLVGVWCGLNWIRFGSPLETGYLRDPTPGFGSSMLTGGAGLLFSPYASLILYSPIVLLGFAGLRALWRRDRTTAMLFGGLVLTFFLLYASLANWMGGRSYGPRYLVPFLPALVLPLAFWTPATAWRRVAVCLALASVLVQIPGVLVDYSQVRMERAAAGVTHAQDLRWGSMPLLLNTRATVINARQTAISLMNLEEAPRLTLDQDLTLALSQSLDLWWVYLVYLGVIGPLGAVGVAMMLSISAAAALRLACIGALHASDPFPPSARPYRA